MLLITPEFLAEVNEVIAVYEDAIGKVCEVAARARHMMDYYGVVDAIARLVQITELQSGFIVLRDRNELDRTFEALIVRYTDLFEEQVVKAAQWRLDNADQLQYKIQ